LTLFFPVLLAEGSHGAFWPKAAPGPSLMQVVFECVLITSELFLFSVAPWMGLSCHQLLGAVPGTHL